MLFLTINFFGQFIECLIDLSHLILWVYVNFSVIFVFFHCDRVCDDPIGHEIFNNNPTGMLRIAKKEEQNVVNIETS